MAGVFPAKSLILVVFGSNPVPLRAQIGVQILQGDVLDKEEPI